MPNRVVRHTLDRKEDGLRAVHFRENPIGKFIFHALNCDATVDFVGFYDTGTMAITITIDEDRIYEFIETTGFGLTE